LDILYQDADLLIVNKPAGLVVHPAVGNTNGTLVNALLYHCPDLATLPRAGLVHRLDKDTSGLLVVARSLRAHSALVRQLSERCIEREYLAIVNGVPVAGGTIDAPIGRHPVNRQRMAVKIGGKPAVTHFKVKRRFHAHALLCIRLETGRTHQIRVHMAHLKFPLLGDPVYGKSICLPYQASPYSIEVIRNFQRQALHAERLALTHPVTGEKLEWHAELPGDLVELLDALE
jgi:23S rRNA pseudouridine1911/1915/1917 synthase